MRQASSPTLNPVRRRAVLVATTIETQVMLTDDAVLIFERLFGQLFQRAERREEATLKRDRRAINAKVRLLARLGEAIMSACAEAGPHFGGGWAWPGIIPVSSTCPVAMIVNRLNWPAWRPSRIGLISTTAKIVFSATAGTRAFGARVVPAQVLILSAAWGIAWLCGFLA